MVLHDLVDRHGRHFSPNSWRVRMALAHKGLAAQTRDVLFTGIAALSPGRKLTIPALEADGEVIADSWRIVRWLDERHPRTPRLIPDGADGEVLRFFQHWAQATIHGGVAGMILLDLWNRLDPADQPYFRESREKTYGTTLEALQAGREERLEAFRASLRPLRMSLADQPFVGGTQPCYADYLAFGGFQWARLSSPFELLAADDPLRGWVERCLDLHDGLARGEPAASA